MSVRYRGVAGQQPDVELVPVLEVVRLGNDPTEVGLGKEVIRSVYSEDRCALRQERRIGVDAAVEHRHEFLAIVRQDRTVSVPLEQVLGA